MIIIYGSNGFVGKYIKKYLSRAGYFYLCSKTRTYNYDEIKREIELYKPTSIISCAGYPTPTNIDYYENSIENKSRLCLTNTAGNIILSEVCRELNIHLVIIMSGCIYNSYEENINSGKIKIQQFTDSDKPNFSGSYYSKNRVATEELLSIHNNLCVVRIRMPITDDMNPKSLITKLVNYRKITNIPNSVTVMDDCMPKIVDVVSRKITGMINLVNEGYITNAYILYLYKSFVNKTYNYSIVSLDEIENKNGKQVAPRSNCIIIPSEILGEMPNVKKSVLDIIKKFKMIKDIYA